MLNSKIFTPQTTNPNCHITLCWEYMSEHIWNISRVKIYTRWTAMMKRRTKWQKTYRMVYHIRWHWITCWLTVWNDRLTGRTGLYQHLVKSLGACQYIYKVNHSILHFISEYVSHGIMPFRCSALMYSSTFPRKKFCILSGTCAISNEHEYFQTRETTARWSTSSFARPFVKWDLSVVRCFASVHCFCTLFILFQHQVSLRIAWSKTMVYIFQVRGGLSTRTKKWRSS